MASQVNPKKAWPFGRWIVIAAALVGADFLAGELAFGRGSFFSAFLKGTTAAFIVMAVLSVGQRLWRGDKISHAEMPGGPAIDFSDAARDTVEKAEGAVKELNERVTAQMTDLNHRLYDLETKVFKEPD